MTTRLRPHCSKTAATDLRLHWLYPYTHESTALPPSPLGLVSRRVDAGFADVHQCKTASASATLIRPCSSAKQDANALGSLTRCKVVAWIPRNRFLQEPFMLDTEK
ncbi:uncharacterized protein LOC144107583 [Amblyomma americanum]